MPTLSITKTYQDGDILTEADLDNICDSVETFLNSTGIDSDNIGTAIIVSKGGTGATSLTDTALLVGNGTSAIGVITPPASGTVLTGVASADPAFSATPTLGVAGTTKGTLALAGNTSGTVTVQPAAAAGTWSLTLPTSGGTSGQFLQTNGSGVSTWAGATTSTVWASYTPTITGLGTVSGLAAFWRRVGDSLHVKVSLTAGTVDAALVSITFPSAASAGIDTAKMCINASSASNGEQVGTWAVDTTNQFGMVVANTSTSTTLVYGGRAINVANKFIPQAGTEVTDGFNTGLLTQFNFVVPISGWTNIN